VNHLLDEQCPQCDDSGYHLWKLRAMIALKETPIKVVGANTLIVGNPIPECPCDCHRSPVVV
jgi:hypothetical protein